nr:probable vacuolar amino acid transporter YPQ1 isoform X1 [Ipomoea batatas]
MEKWWLKMAENTAVAYCVGEEKACVGWVYKHFNDCLCNVRDELSFCLGLASFVCWGVAEIPQIFTNFQTKSSHGISLLFLLTWITGDIFNLVGCLLEPATVYISHKKFIMHSLLYTTTTLVLVLQSLYYDYVYKSWKCKAESLNQPIEEVKKPLWPPKSVVSGIPIPSDSARAGPQNRIDYYYTSARSLAGSATPPFRSSLCPIKSGPSALGIQDNDASSDDEAAKNYSFIQTKGFPRSAGYGAFLATTVNTPRQAKALMSTYVAFGGRKLLQQEDGAEHGASGQWLGWMMAAIYMSSRLPQIWLNVISLLILQGLNPFMFIFALIANLTYVGSIVMRTTEWDKIEPNLPWLFDAAGCVMLDLLVSLSDLLIFQKEGLWGK